MARDTALKNTPVRTGITLNFPSPEQRIEARKQELIKMLREQRIMNDKFNSETVSRLTGLRGPELIDFMRYCNFSKEYLLRTNHYDVLVATLVIFDHWKLLKEKRALEMQRARQKMN
jgi:hypothetical protein